MTPGQGMGRGDDSTGQKNEELAKSSPRASIDNLRL